MNSNDISLYYTEHGSGENLILLHGNAEDSEYFVHQIPEFSKKYHVIAVDTRGHGKTKRGTKPFTIRQFAEDLFFFMEDHKIEKANILGFSDGGNIALLFALKYPEKVEKMIINGANLNPKGVVFKEQLPTDLAYYCTHIFSKISKRAKKKSEMLRLMVKDPNIKIENLNKIKAETLVIAGTKDLIKESHTIEIYKALSNAALAFVEGNHFMAKYNSKEFNKKVDAFLGVNKRNNK